MADKDADAKQVYKVLVYMYKVRCENIGFSKDSLLTDTSDFAILVGQELQDEVIILLLLNLSRLFGLIEFKMMSHRHMINW